jgi:aminopeptidase N
MTGNENLTRAEAQERASLIDSRAFDVRLDLTTGAETFATTTTATPMTATTTTATTTMTT